MTTARPGAAPGDYRAGLLDALRTIEQLRGRIKELDSGARALAEPIAVVGLSCRLPGGAQDPEAYWRMLGDGVDATGEFPAERADARALYDPDPDAPGKAYTIRGGFLGRVDRFEPAVFGISPREALGMDPQQRLALEVAWEALERAGYAPDALDGSGTGVYLGVSTTDYVRLRQAHGSAADVDAYQLIGEPSFVAGRISYTLGLRGPSKVVDTTCSSSLVAVHEACQALRLGECDMALAGGVNLMLAPYGFLLMSKMRALSPDGRCKTFDATADGYARGEGAGVVVLKRLSDAIRDRDHIAAVLRGSAVNHDGRSSGLTVPNPAAQQQVINGALAQAGIAAGEVDYVEAHGTGTALGDPIELRALQAALARHRTDGEPLLVGSVKTNIGHLEAAAGVAGLIKLILSLQHGRIPAHLHFTTPNPNVDWDRLRIRVTAEPQKWPERGRERIGAISSFGSSGTNAHAVVSSAPDPEPEPVAAPAGAPYGLLLASARTPEALRETAERYARELRRQPEAALADVCWTAQVGRARQQYGLAVVGDGLDSLTEALERYARGEHDPRLAAATLPAYKHRKTAWLFTGQGAQYPGMGRDLLGEPAFRAAFEECERLIDPLLGRPLREVLWPQAPQLTGRPIGNTRYAQPALFAVEYALARMWLAWGVRPGALLGHSVGEIAAACVAGVFGLADACRLVVARADLMAALPPGGAMAAVTCSEDTARAALAGRSGRLAVAAVNGPTETVLSGDAADLTAVLAELAAQGVRGRRLAVSHAFHSPLLEPMLKEFRAVAEELTYTAPAVPLISDVTGRPWGPAEIGPDYWVRHAASPVRFHDGLTTLRAEGYRTFLEIGPAPGLTGRGDRATDDPDCAWIPSLLPPAPAGRPDAAGRPDTHGRATVR
ncbi:type I polyketide synthase, partial [Streptomyces sp.]|uniref:type I polyketide synthase n=1 Tax=Streptomyces sp. TaxID=1931 RepID=UPI002F3EADC9